MALVAIAVTGMFMLPSDNGRDPVESGLVERADVDLVPFRDPQGAYEISVPEGWVTMSFDGDTSDLGRRTFPEDPELAAAFQELANTGPSELRFLSVDPDETTPRELGSNVNIAQNPSTDYTDREVLLSEAQRGVRASGGHVTGDGTFMTPAGEAVRVTYELPDSVSGVQYLVGVGDAVWTLTYTSREIPDEVPVADAIAATFALGRIGG